MAPHCRTLLYYPIQKNKLLAYPKNRSDLSHLLFDLEERNYDSLDDTTRHDISHIASDPHHPNIVAATGEGDRNLKTFDATTDNLQSCIKLSNKATLLRFDPHHTDSMAYAAGDYIRIINPFTGDQYAALKHKAPIIDFDFNPHKPYELLVTQKNGETVKWTQQSTPYSSLRNTIHFLKTGKFKK